MGLSYSLIHKFTHFFAKSVILLNFVSVNLVPVATYRGPIKAKFGTPRQSGLAPAVEGRVEFLEGYGVEEALKGLEGFSRIWLIWGFSLNGKEQWSPTVRPPRLGGNRTMGVWATRSPYRPNPIGLSCVEVTHIGKNYISVKGADLVDGTPIFDIKPYIPYADAFPDSKPGFAAEAPERKLKVDFSDGLPFSAEQLRALEQILSLDPRPAYQDDETRTYGLAYEGYDVHFNIKGNVLTVLDARKGTELD
ncbi:MAG: tRNA (N6-threonylcarbamoyladenosine(37)-N6)-methyltransferase TrmO [Bacteroidales bacterium]|nr:tRNA (N6-threonylcarbamoyladenosine(37)-N6)-methyltransferase TrmO [Bacteroidales bacterium]